MKIEWNIRLLPGKGAYVNAAKPDGYTPLHYAANEGHKNIAEEQGHKEIAELLRKHGAKE